mmetsp:Transcript_112513/g.313007  ORF Transcript_112513/g.313007 Transcript_112513/m.313007 type:complete len:290 (-) Transcript_112513:771-1640(-)
MPDPLNSKTCQPVSLWATKTPATPFSSVRFCKPAIRTLTPNASSRETPADSDSGAPAGSAGAGPGSAREASAAEAPAACGGGSDSTCVGFSAESMTFNEKMRATSFLSTPPLTAASRAAFISARSPEAAAAASRWSNPECFCCVLLRAASKSSKYRCASMVSSRKSALVPSSMHSRSLFSLSFAFSTLSRNSRSCASRRAFSAFMAASCDSAYLVCSLSTPAARAWTRALWMPSALLLATARSSSWSAAARPCAPAFSSSPLAARSLPNVGSSLSTQWLLAPWMRTQPP